MFPDKYSAVLESITKRLDAITKRQDDLAKRQDDLYSSIESLWAELRKNKSAVNTLTLDKYVKGKKQ